MVIEDVINRAIDALGMSENVIGSIYDGSTISEVFRRSYGQTLRQLLRAAHWTFARKRATLQILADATGQTLDPATGKPISAAVEAPWLYCYAWPIDGVNARWMPWNGAFSQITTGVPAGNTSIGSAPLMTNLTATPSAAQREVPARFLVSTSSQFPTLVGQGNPPNFDAVEGLGVTGRRVILCNVPPTTPCAFVYTWLVLEPSLWDEMFTQAMVAALAERAALAIIPDKKMAFSMRNAQIAIARDLLREARVASGNDVGFPQTTDHVPDWISSRRIGRGVWWGAGTGGGFGPGSLWSGWDSYSFSDGAVF